MTATVFDDLAADTFTAGTANDWLFGTFVAGDSNPDSIMPGTASIAQTEADDLS